jgi:predicted dehydrogenase
MADGIIRVGLIGAGANTRLRHIGGLREQQGVEVVGVANRSRESGERFAGEFEVPKVYDNWKDLMDDEDVDAVCIGTWPYMHRTLVLEALERGKHVLTEARMAMNAKEAQDMLDASRRHPDVIAQIVPAPGTLQVDETIIDTMGTDFLGDILAVRLRVADAHGRQAGGTPDTFVHPEGEMHWRHNRELSGYNILGMGIWYESIMRYVGPASKVMAMTKVCVQQRTDADGRMHSVAVPDHVNVLCEMACGAQADMSWSTVTGLQGGAEFWIFGSEGTIALNGPPIDKVWGGRRGDSELKEIPIADEKRGGWRVEEEFINAIRGKEPITRTPFDVGVQYMEWTEAVTRSAQQGKAIDLPL